MVGASTRSPALEVVPGARLGAAQQLTAFIEILLLGVWLGSMIFFSFGVAPSAFSVLPTREMAGVMVTSTIGKIEILGLIIGPLLILIQAANWRKKQASATSKGLQAVLLLLMTATAALSHFRISPAMVSLRAAMGGHIDTIPLTDPTRIQFNDLHQYSVALMGTAMFAGVVVLFITVRSWLTR